MTHSYLSYLLLPLHWIEDTSPFFMIVPFPWEKWKFMTVCVTLGQDKVGNINM